MRLKQTPPKDDRVGRFWCSDAEGADANLLPEPIHALMLANYSQFDLRLWNFTKSSEQPKPAQPRGNVTDLALRGAACCALFLRFFCRPPFFRPGLILFVFFSFVLVIIVVGVSRRRRVAHDRDEAPVDQPRICGVG